MVPLTSKKPFTPLSELQLPSHCGPCSLSACLFILGNTATQRQLARAAGRPLSVFRHGVDEEGLRRAAREYGVKSEFVLHKDPDKGRAFAGALRRHLRAGNPAILLIKDFEHWVAVIGYLSKQRKYVVVDPKDKDNLFLRWSERSLLRAAWNRNTIPRGGEPSQYFTILLSRRYKRPARWAITETWLRLCERGSVDTAENMVRDLQEIAGRASPARSTIGSGPNLVDVLEKYEDVILDSIAHWGAGSDKVDRGTLRSFYEDYVIIAGATGIRISRSADISLVIAQLTALLASYWWGARF